MDFLFEIFKNAPNLVKIISYGLISLLVLGIVIIMLLSTFKMYKALDKENLAFKISEKNAELNNSLNLLNSRTNELIISSDTLIHFFSEAEKKLYTMETLLNKPIKASDLSEYKKIVEKSKIESGKIIKDFLNHLSSEISRTSRVRVSLWGIDKEDDSLLSRIDESSNFYSNSTKTKKVHIDQSIIGRAYRTNTNQYIYDVKNDPDWENSFNKNYNAIVAIKLTNLKNVLSLDFTDQPDKSDLILIEFSAIILTYFSNIINSNNNIGLEKITKLNDELLNEDISKMSLSMKNINKLLKESNIFEEALKGKGE